MTGYRIGRLAYLTDFKTIEDAEVEKPGCGGAGGQCAALCRALLHFNVAEALELIRRVGPREAWLTHMSHDIGLQAEMEPTHFPPGVHMACDTRVIEWRIGTPGCGVKSKNKA